MLPKTRITGLVITILALLVMPSLGAPQVGERIDFNATSIDGKTVNSRTLRGKMVLLEFWATTCSTCVAEAPHMAKLQEELGPKGLQIVGVTLDEKADAPLKFMKEAGWTWPQVLDKPQRRLQRQFGVEGTPTLFLINPDGVLVWNGDVAGLDGAIEEHMQKTPPRLPQAKPAAGAAAPTPGAPTSANEAKAKSALSMAAAYKTSGKYDLARQRYEQVIKEFPDTPQAAEAKKELAALPK